MVYSPQGEPLQVEGLTKGIEDVLHEAENALAVPGMKKLFEQMKDSLGDDIVRENLRAAFRMLPDEGKARVGDKWVREWKQKLPPLDITAVGHGEYELAGIEERYSFGADGPLVHVWPRGEAEPREPTHGLDEPMGDGLLRLVGYDAAILEEAGGPALALALYWQPDGQIDGNYKLSLRVLDEMGEPLADGAGNVLVADRFPLRQVAPTWSWLPAEMVRDVQTIDLPTDWRDRASRLQVIVYDAESIAEIGRWELNLATLRP